MKTSIGLLSISTLALQVGCGAEPENGSENAGEPVQQQLATQVHAHVVPGCGDHEDEHDGPEAREQASHRRIWRSKHKPGKRGTVAAKILGFNDFHGQIEEGRFVGGRPVGGGAVLASYLRTAATGFEGKSLIIHAGDHVGASPPESALLQDEPSIQFLNTLTNSECDGPLHSDRECNVIGTLGNHEFDEGKDEMFRLLFGGDHPSGPFLESPWRGAKFPYVNANVTEKRRKQDRTILRPYVVRNLGGVRVGVVGAVLKETPTIVTPTGVAGLTFRDEAQAINEQVAELKRRGIQTIVVTIHKGAFQTSYGGATQAGGGPGEPILSIISQLDDAVDLVISGHSHTFSNAYVANASGHEILVTQAFSASTAYADIDLELDRDSGDVITKSASIVTTYSDMAPGNVRDPAAQEIADAAKALTAPLVNRLITTVDRDITRTQNDAGESALGNLIADAQRAATGTDFAFMNPGGIRADLVYAANPGNPADSAGNVLWGELFTIQPFGNSLVTMTFSGQQVYDLLNQQFTVNRFLQISGLTYSWDASLPATGRVVEVRKDGVPLDPSATYTITCNNFLATGGDGFTVFTGGANQVGGDIDLDAFVSYLQAAPAPVAAPELGRITRLN